MVKKERQKKRLSFPGFSFVVDDNFVSYSSLNGKSFRVYKKDIETISLDTAGMGVSKMRINGKGALLAEVELASPFLKKAQEFIYENLNS